MSSFKDRFSKKISVFNKDGCTSKIDGTEEEGSRKSTMYTIRDRAPKQRGVRSVEERAAEGGQLTSSGGRGALRPSPNGRATLGSSGSASRSSAAKPRRAGTMGDSLGAGGGYRDPPATRKPPRQPVEYTPHTYAEYQTVCQPGKWEKMGNLGPDLQDDELIEKRAQKERIKEYSRNLRAQNAYATQNNKHIKMRESSYHDEVVKEPTKREKMAQYASQVPKPRVAKKKVVMTDDGYDGYGQAQEAAPLTILEQLEAKHRQDQIAVAAIRKEMGLDR